jgi:N-acetylglucosaminyldiphosphoundecaprenol N-acetyl-beta-D-mannosaminyltransferase
LRDNKINILGLNIINASYEDIVNTIFEKLQKKEKLSFHNVNASILLKYINDKEFKNSLDSFTRLYSDGTGMYFASRFCYGKNGLKQRITGTDLYSYILNYANSNKLKCFFFGGSEESANLLPGVLRSKYPGISVAGIIPRTTEMKTEVADEIKNSKPDILFVGLGTPYQEKWIAEYSDIISVPIQIAVGSGLEFISGSKKRAPAFFLKFGLEWLYRIYLEPGRLWKRYIFGIPIFIFKIIKFKLKLLTIKENKQV